MMEPWQVWTVDELDNKDHFVLIVSSAFHLRVNTARLVTVIPLTENETDLDYRVPLHNQVTGTTLWAVTDQILTIVTNAMSPVRWQLGIGEIEAVRRVLKRMVDLG